MAQDYASTLTAAVVASAALSVTAAPANCTLVTCSRQPCDPRAQEMKCTCRPGYKFSSDTLTCEEATRFNNALWPAFVAVGIVIVVGAVAVQIRQSRATSLQAASMAAHRTSTACLDPPSYADAVIGGGDGSVNLGGGQSSVLVSGAGDDATTLPPSYAEATLMLMLQQQNHPDEAPVVIISQK